VFLSSRTEQWIWTNSCALPSKKVIIAGINLGENFVVLKKINIRKVCLVYEKQEENVKNPI
jgi:hypothetical protein